MKTFREQELRRSLGNFERVWRRVTAAKAPRETAERRGLRLMPRAGCCRRDRRV